VSRSQQKGTSFETSIARGLAEALDDDRIERRARAGAKDRGDIGGVRVHGQRLVIECKNVKRQDIPGWIREAHVEAGNDSALVGVVVSKRRGTTNPLDQYVHMEVRDLLALITGQRQEGCYE
jgi:hypothetical protein